MQKIIFITILLIFCQLNPIKAQINETKFGLKVGIQSFSLTPSTLFINDEGDLNDAELQLKSGKYGFHFGLQIPVTINNFIIQPEIVFNSNSVEYDYEDINTTNALQERYNYLDIPLLFGYRLGFIRFMGGPVGHIFIQSSSDLFDINGYESSFNNLTWAYQLGVGLTITKFTLDVRYEGGFNKFGSHLMINDKTFKFNSRPERLLMSLGFLF